MGAAIGDYRNQRSRDTYPKVYITAIMTQLSEEGGGWGCGPVVAQSTTDREIPGLAWISLRTRNESPINVRVFHIFLYKEKIK